MIALALCFILTAACSTDEYKQELVVVSKIPRGAYAGEEMPSGELYDFGWHEIGLSRNGKEPIEYIWYANYDGWGYVIINAEIGDKGTVRLTERAKERNIELPRPNADDPPIIGALGEVDWEKRE